MGGTTAASSRKGELGRRAQAGGAGNRRFHRRERRPCCPLDSAGWLPPPVPRWCCCASRSCACTNGAAGEGGHVQRECQQAAGCQPPAWQGCMRVAVLRQAVHIPCQPALPRTLSASISCRISSSVGLSRFLKAGNGRKRHAGGCIERTGHATRTASMQLCSGSSWAWDSTLAHSSSRHSSRPAAPAAARQGGQQHAALESKCLLDRRQLLERKVEQQQPACGVAAGMGSAG